LAAAAAVESRLAWEVVVVDNGSTDSTRHVIADAAERTPCIRSVFEAQKGLGAARDTGWRAAEGEIVAFTDDDCYLSPTFVDDLFRVFAEKPELGFVGGRVLLHDPEDLPVTIDLRDAPEAVPCHRFLPAGTLQGANLSFRRLVLARLGGVDRGIGAGTPYPFEDIDLIAAAAWAGVKGIYDPRPTVSHHHRRRSHDFPMILADYDRGRGAYYMKYILRADSRLAYILGWIRKTRQTTGWRFPEVWEGLGREFHSAWRWLGERGSRLDQAIFSVPLLLGLLTTKVAAARLRSGDSGFRALARLGWR